MKPQDSRSHKAYHKPPSDMGKGLKHCSPPGHLGETSQLHGLAPDVGGSTLLPLVGGSWDHGSSSTGPWIPGNPSRQE